MNIKRHASNATHATVDATQGANAATMDATQTANNATSAMHWLSVAQAAEVEGVTPRAIQRRCASGKYRSRRAQTPQGERLEVDAATLTNHATQGRDARDPPRDARRDGRDARRDGRDDEPQQRRDAGDAQAPERRDPRPENAPTDAKGDQQAAPNFAARYVAQIEAENAFLRATVEQHQRSEAELRAALRKALEVAPRQLPEGTTAAPPIAQEATPTTAPTDTTSNPEAPAKSPPIAKGAIPKKSEPRPLWKLILGLK